MPPRTHSTPRVSALPHHGLCPVRATPPRTVPQSAAVYTSGTTPVRQAGDVPALACADITKVIEVSLQLAQRRAIPAPPEPPSDALDTSRSTRLLYCWGLLTIRWRWPLVVVPLLIALGCIPLAMQVTDQLTTGAGFPQARNRRRSIARSATSSDDAPPPTTSSFTIPMAFCAPPIPSFAARSSGSFGHSVPLPP